MELKTLSELITEAFLSTETSFRIIYGCHMAMFISSGNHCNIYRFKAIVFYCFVFCLFLSLACSTMLSKMQKIRAVAPELTVLVQAHEEGTFKGGVEALNSLIQKTIDKAGLWTKEIRHPSVVGVHPDNREKSMLVPIDVHDLLLKFKENGYNADLWDALAVSIPEGPIGEQWRLENTLLVAASEGLLADVDASSLEIITGRGSHGTAALRCVIFGARSPHKSLCDAHGQVSKAVLLQHQPSWQEPLEQGLMYRIFPGELEIAVPGLLAALSRMGNAHHDVFRHKTALQMCNRIHSVLKTKMQNKKGAVDVEDAAHIACQGNGGSSYLQQCLQLIAFVQAWSGGLDGHILRDLESFERSCTLKRQLAPADLKSLADVDMLHAPIYIKAACFNLVFFLLIGSHYMMRAYGQ